MSKLGRAPGTHVAKSTDIRARIKGRSKVLIHALDRLERAARVHATSILINGETGTGLRLTSCRYRIARGQTSAIEPTRVSVVI